MIRYALACEHGHEFEGWFGSSADYDAQAERGLIACPVCDSRAVAKQIMAPAVSGTKKTAAPDVSPQMRSMVMEAMGKVRAHVEENFDYVGDAFAGEARAIHEGRAPERAIRGEASADETRALLRDGIPVMPLPFRDPNKAN